MQVCKNNMPSPRLAYLIMSFDNNALVDGQPGARWESAESLTGQGAWCLELRGQDDTNKNLSLKVPLGTIFGAQESSSLLMRRATNERMSVMRQCSDTICDTDLVILCDIFDAGMSSPTCPSILRHTRGTESFRLPYPWCFVMTQLW